MSDLAIVDVGVTYGRFAAVSDVTLAVSGGATLALVGESGSGKSSLAHAIARLLPPGTGLTGSVCVGGRELASLRGRDLRDVRGRVVSYLAQDAMAALNPVMRVGRQVGEVFARHQGLSRREAAGRAGDLLRRVGIQAPDLVARKFPHELSGGMRQRVMIAIALALSPEVLVADEPTTALDVTVQAEILALVRALQAERGFAVVWITHDMGVVAEIADDVAVMYGGRIVEQGPARDLFAAPAHPYTRALMAAAREQSDAVPKAPFVTIPGQPPVGELPSGCAFHPRCPLAFARCTTERPGSRPVGEGRRAACHLAG